MAGSVFITGGTGYIGRRVVLALLAKGRHVKALVRRGSEHKTAAGCQLVVGDPFDRATFLDGIDQGDTFLQLLGVPHPSPAKAQQFIDIDLRSATESVAAASTRSVGHFIYVSVAHPAPVMQAYQDARRRAEQALNDSGLRRTIVRPWYVLGPGHRWPYLLLPVYWVLERVPATRERAQRLGLVTIDQMVSALVNAVEHPPERERIVDVPQIRAAANRT